MLKQTNLACFMTSIHRFLFCSFIFPPSCLLSFLRSSTLQTFTNSLHLWCLHPLGCEHLCLQTFQETVSSDFKVSISWSLLAISITSLYLLFRIFLRFFAWRFLRFFLVTSFDLQLKSRLIIPQSKKFFSFVFNSLYLRNENN